ncbi:MAG: hypothetical protein AAF960_28170 [Bacteroidota bacterium]
MKFIYYSLLSFLCLNSLIAQNNSFTGTFSNEQVGLVLKLNAKNEASVTGTFELQGQIYDVKAQVQETNTVVGSYVFHGNVVPIQLMNLNGSYILVTEGVTIPMTFKAATAASLTSVKNEPSNANKVEAATNIAIPMGQSTTTKRATGRTFADPAVGFQFSIPNDWIGQQIEGGSYLIGHNTKLGFVLVMPHNYTDLQQMYRESAQGIHEEGIQLMLTRGLQQRGKNGLMGDYEGMIQGQMVKAHAIGLIAPHGGGLTMLVAVRKDLYSRDYFQTLESIANSVVFKKPKVTAAAKNWNQRLSGAKLTYYNTSNGFSDKIVIDLCTNGQFGYNSNSSGMSGGASVLTYAGQDAGQGTWTISSRGNTGLLILSFHNGERSEYELSNRDSEGQINLNGRRYFVQGGKGCL